MELRDILYQMMQENQRASQPTDLRIGTVTAAEPLEITVDTAAAPLRSQVLYLTESVVEKKIPVLQHTHEIATLSHAHSNSAGGTTEGLTERYPTEEALSHVACLENGKALPVADGHILLNRALAVGDKVLLLRVQNGQRFVVLSRVF